MLPREGRLQPSGSIRTASISFGYFVPPSGESISSSGNNAQVFEGESIFAELDGLKSPDFGVFSSESLRFWIWETRKS
jgi:hypothetical protein